jgi:hypothetical protein
MHRPWVGLLMAGWVLGGTACGIKAAPRPPLPPPPPGTVRPQASGEPVPETQQPSLLSPDSGTP